MLRRATAIALIAVAVHFAVSAALWLDERYLGSRFTIPPYACPIAIMRDKTMLPWCTENRWDQ